MRYQSNLAAPDLAPNFRLKNPPLQTMGHDMPSDPDFLPGCGYWTHDEAAILFHCTYTIGGTVAGRLPRMADIGSRLGWTAQHMMAAGAEVWGIDPEYAQPAFVERALQQAPFMIPVALMSYDFFTGTDLTFDGAVIDGNHDSPEPTRDAEQAIIHGAGVLLFHDFQGQPVRDAVTMCMELGAKCRVYDTPNGVAVCWFGDEFVPPDHIPDPNVDWAAVRGWYSDFDFTRCV